MSNGYAVLKLISGEELLGSILEETEYKITIIMPMSIKYVPKVMGLKTTESVLLAPFTQFASDDVFTFDKAHLIYLKDMDERYIKAYEDSVDLYLSPQSTIQKPNKNEDLKKTMEKLESLFGDGFQQRMSEDEYLDQLLNFDPDTKKLH